MVSYLHKLGAEKTCFFSLATRPRPIYLPPDSGEVSGPVTEIPFQFARRALPRRIFKVFFRFFLNKEKQK